MVSRDSPPARRSLGIPPRKSGCSQDHLSQVCAGVGGGERLDRKGPTQTIYCVSSGPFYFVSVVTLSLSLLSWLHLVALVSSPTERVLLSPSHGDTALVCLISCTRRLPLLENLLFIDRRLSPRQWGSGVLCRRWPSPTARAACGTWQSSLVWGLQRFSHLCFPQSFIWLQGWGPRSRAQGPS